MGSGLGQGRDRDLGRCGGRPSLGGKPALGILGGGEEGRLAGSRALRIDASHGRQKLQRVPEENYYESVVLCGTYVHAVDGRPSV